MPGQMCTECPEKFGLIAHRLRCGFAPHFEYTPENIQEENRASIGKHWSGIAQALDKIDSKRGVLVGDSFEIPEFIFAGVAVVRDKHMDAALAAGWPAKGDPPKSRFATDHTGCGVNPALSRWPYRLDSYHEAARHMTPGCWFAVVDLSTYFHSLPWTEDFSKKYGHFRDPRRDGGKWRFKGTKPPRDWPHKDAHKPPYRRYATCSFGASSVPAWASTITGVLLGFLRQHGVRRSTGYVDDFLLIGDTKEECQAKLDAFIALVESLGLAVAKTKTLGPAQTIEFLGLELCSITMEVRITAKRAAKIKAKLKEYLAAGRASRKQLHTLQGKLGWVSEVLCGGRAFVRTLINAVSATRGQRGSTWITIDGEMREDFEWWLQHLTDLKDKGSRVWLDENDFTVLSTKSDAAGRLGWGAVVGPDLIFSKWTAEEAADTDMTYKELVPVLYIVENYGPQLEDTILRVGLDNAAAVFDVLKFDSKTYKVRQILKRIARAQAEWNFRILATHVTRGANELADLLTRFIRLEELDDALPDDWQVDADGALLQRCQWRLTTASNSVLRLSATRRSTPA
jgi:hypothetical protein